MGLKTAAKKYLYSGQQNPADVTFSSLTNSDSVLIKEVTSKVKTEVTITSTTRGYWYFAAPHDLGYDIYDVTGSLVADLKSTQITIDNIVYDVWITDSTAKTISQCFA